MAKYRITYDRDACIGSAACASVDPKHFRMNRDGKADFPLSKEAEPGLFLMETDDIKDAVEAEKNCPVNAIRIEKIE